MCYSYVSVRLVHPYPYGEPDGDCAHREAAAQRPLYCFLGLSSGILVELAVKATLQGRLTSKVIAGLFAQRGIRLSVTKACDCPHLRSARGKVEIIRYWLFLLVFFLFLEQRQLAASVFQQEECTCHDKKNALVMIQPTTYRT